MIHKKFIIPHRKNDMRRWLFYFAKYLERIGNIIYKFF